MARKVGQIIARGDRRWLIRVYLGHDHETNDARWCFNQYFAELNRRFEGGFDPGLGTSADPQELTSPMGLLLIARLHGQLLAEHSSFINEDQRN